MIKQIKSLVQFSRGTSLVWEALATPIPDGVLTFSIDDGVFKLGDGISLYPLLPVLFSYADLVSAQGGISNLFQEPTIDQNGNIVVVSVDAGTSEIKYSVSTTSLASLLAAIEQLEATNVAQDAAIAEVLALALSIDVSINTGSDNSIIIVNNRRYTNSGTTLSAFQAQIAAEATYVPGSHLEDPIFYTDIDRSNIADKLHLFDNNTYYVDIIGFNNSTDAPIFTLTSQNTDVVITKLDTSFFSISLNNVTDGVKDDTPVVLLATVNTTTGYSAMKKAIACLVQRQRIIVATYGGTLNDYYGYPTVDDNNNIFIVGVSLSESYGGAAYGDIHLIKFDSSLNILKRIRLGGTNEEVSYAIDTDSKGNVFLAGMTYSEGVGGSTAIVYKFDNDLNLKARKLYGGSAGDSFIGIVVDHSDNVICVGYTSSEGTGVPSYTTALIVKFDNNLGVLISKLFNGIYGDSFRRVTVDKDNNIITNGTTYSEGPNPLNYAAGITVKYDSMLNLIAAKTYGGSTGDTILNGMVTDSVGNIFAVGQTAATGVAFNKGIILKYDKDLNLIAKKYYTDSTNASVFNGAIVDKDDNVIVSGSGIGPNGSADALLVIFDNNLTTAVNKTCGGNAVDGYTCVILDKHENIVVAGQTSSDGSGSADILIAKFPRNIPAGVFVGSVLSGITISTSPTLVMAEAILTSALSALVSTTPTTMTLTDSNLTLSKSTLAYERDIFN